MTTTAITLQTIDPALLEQVVVHGDLSRLNPAQRLEWYRHRCDAAGLDVRTAPLAYLNLQGKLVLYATKTTTDQLIANRKLQVQIIDRRQDGELYEVLASVTRPDGSTVDDLGIVSTGALKGEALANARLKAVTKAKRRAVLSACGLGTLDESEVDSIDGARRVPMEVVHGQVQPVQTTPPVRRLPASETAKRRKESTPAEREAWVRAQMAAPGDVPTLKATAEQVRSQIEKAPAEEQVKLTLLLNNLLGERTEQLQAAAALDGEA